MKPETTRGARRPLPRRKRSHRVDATAKSRPQAGPDEDFDPVEFAEFLEADDGPLPIDPVFRERLREQLWGIVCDRAHGGSSKRPPRRDS